LNVGDVLFAISEAELSLETSMTEDTLKLYPAENLTPELAAAIKEHKPKIIKIMREDELFRRTGIIQCESQVFKLAREYFGLDDKGGTRGPRPPHAHRAHPGRLPEQGHGHG
jgi:hypothetical protein